VDAALECVGETRARGVGPVATGRSGWFDQALHEPGVEGRVVAGDGEREHLLSGADARTAIDTDRAVAEAHRLESRAQFRGRAQSAVGIQIVRGGGAERARDVSRARIERFDLAAIALAGARVEERAARTDGERSGFVGRELCPAPRVQCHAARRGLDLAGLERKPRGAPRGGPPSSTRAATPASVSIHHARAGPALVVVVDHDASSPSSTPQRRADASNGRRGQRMPPLGRVAVRCELAVESGVDRTGHVPVEIEG
jgi:hypothetical protein